MSLSFNILNSVSLGNVHSMVLAYQWWEPKKPFPIYDGNQKMFEWQPNCFWE
jgi:hypothetical protein